MKNLGCFLGALGLLTLTGSMQAQEPAPTAPPAVPQAPVVSLTYPGGCTACGQMCPACQADCDLFKAMVDAGVKWPFEIYARIGVTSPISTGQFDDVIHAGLATEFGSRVYFPAADCRAAWIGDVGIDWFHNKGDSTVPVIERGRTLEVTHSNGQQESISILERSGIAELDRIYLRVEGGREWYFGGECDGSARYVLGLDSGVRLGSARAGLHVLQRIPLVKFQLADTDTLAPTGAKKVTDIDKNLFVAAVAGMIIPCCGCDIELSGRVEFSHDFIRLPGLQELDQSLDQIQLLLTAGVRY